MKSVWKYELSMSGVTELELPDGAKVLHVADQKGLPYMWVLVDIDTEAKEFRTFVVRGTGHQVEENRIWVGTWQSPPFVWHLFEIPIQ